jgi:long-chain acyl-CoA synthetase
LLDTPFTIESGELTPTMKLKRKVIEERFKELIDSFYK